MANLFSIYRATITFMCYKLNGSARIVAIIAAHARVKTVWYRFELESKSL